MDTSHFSLYSESGLLAVLRLINLCLNTIECHAAWFIEKREPEFDPNPTASHQFPPFSAPENWSASSIHRWWLGLCATVVDAPNSIRGTKELRFWSWFLTWAYSNDTKKTRRCLSHDRQKDPTTKAEVGAHGWKPMKCAPKKGCQSSYD